MMRNVAVNTSSSGTTHLSGTVRGLKCVHPPDRRAHRNKPVANSSAPPVYLVAVANPAAAVATTIHFLQLPESSALMMANTQRATNWAITASGAIHRE